MGPPVAKLPTGARTSPGEPGGDVKVGCAITPSELIRTFKGVAVAAKIAAGSVTESAVQWISLQGKLRCALSGDIDRQAEDALITKIPFADWRAAVDTESEDQCELRSLLTLALAVAYLRSECCDSTDDDLSADLELVWQLVRDAVVQLSTQLTVSRSAQGFIAVPLCSLIVDGNIDELWRLHVWQADEKRGNPAFAIHAHQAFAQSWILAGAGTDHAYDVSPVEEPDAATHAAYRLGWGDGQTSGMAYKTHQRSSTVVNTNRYMSAALRQSEVHVRDTTYKIPAAHFHASEVNPHAFHATLFVFDSRRGFVQDTPVLGPRDLKSHTQARGETGGVTAAELADVVDAFRRWEALMAEGKRREQRAETEGVLQAYDRALSLCGALPDPNRYRARVLAELGSVNRRFGRYTQAVECLERALEMTAAHDQLSGIQIHGELGVVYRHMGLLDDAKRVLEGQYKQATMLGSDREMCRAVGNLGMVCYQLYLQTGDAHLLESAIAYQTERIERARLLKLEIWECIGLARISLLHTANGRPKDAIDAASKSLEIIIRGKDSTAIAISRFFYGRALLADEQRDDALQQFNVPNTCTPAMAFCQEPSDEHIGYLRELIEAGADLDLADEQGYTALDHAVFNGDPLSERLVMEGLRQGPNGKTECQLDVMIMEAKVRKGYREIFQEKLRPQLLSSVGSHSLRKLRMAYREALAADEAKLALFDNLKFLRYSDFAAFGQLPRSSDNLTQQVPVTEHDDSDPSIIKPADFIIFFSYRWITSSQGACSDREEQYLLSPDDEHKTQYRRMIHATEELLQLHPEVDRERLGIWVDFSCVDQDSPSAGVNALPMIVAQCDAVISLVDDEYYERAWCSVEIAFIQQLRKSYHRHLWYEHVQVSSDVVSGHGQYVLREAPTGFEVSMAVKKLSYELDRPKVLFLERQSKLLG